MSEHGANGSERLSPMLKALVPYKLMNEAMCASLLSCSMSKATLG